MAPERLIAAALCLLGASCTGVTGREAPTSAPGTSAAATSTTAAGAAAEVLQVFDGDTLLASIEGAEEEVRLLGINAPERDECFGSEATEAAKALLRAGPLTLEVMGERDQFGRLLAYAHAGGALVNYELLRAGYAVALQGDHRRLAEFLEADERAFAEGIGLWAPAACGPASAASPVIAGLEPDPGGPDEDDLNGEWVLIANRGGEAADLSGWVLRDESSEHRFTFPGGTSLGPGEEVAVHTGCGQDGPGDLYWCADGSPAPVWNNGGDTALLLDPRGNVAARFRYGA